MYKLLPILLLLSGASRAADYPLLPLVPENSGSVVGFDAGRMLGSHFGRRILEKMQSADPRLKMLLNLGLDPKDIRQVVVAGGSGPSSNSLILVSGAFPSRQLLQGLAVGLATGSAKKTVYDGIEMLGSGDGNAIAFADDQTLMLGSDSLIRGAIDRRKLKQRKNAALLERAGRWMNSHDLWFASSGPTNDFTGQVTERATGGAVNEGILRAFDRTYGGLRFSDSLEVGVETVARTERDAASMVKVMKVLSTLSMLTKGATSGLGFLDSLDIKAEGSMVSFSLKIPRTAFDAMHPPDSI